MKKLALVIASILAAYKRKTSVVSDQTNTDALRENIQVIFHLNYISNSLKIQGGNMENNKNLLIETLNLLEKNNRTWEDVTEVFVVGKYNIGKDEFHKLASSTNYNWNKDEINRNLVIKGNDFIINVHYADGFRTYLDLIDLKVPELSVDNPNLFNFFNNEYVGD